VAGSSEVDGRPAKSNRPATQLEQPGARLGQVAPRGVSVPGNGVARGKPLAPGQTKTKARTTGSERRAGTNAKKAKASTPGQSVRADRQRATAERRAARAAQQPEKTPKAQTRQKVQESQGAASTTSQQQGTRAYGAPTKKAAAVEASPTANDTGPPTEKAGGPKN
jgi:hypothetical protein